MTRISQLIAVVGGVKSDVTAQMAGLAAAVTQSDLVNGIIKTYRPRFEDNDQSAAATTLAAVVGSAASVRPPEENTRVRVTVEDTLAKVEQLMTRLFDVTRTLDQSNAELAKADVKVGEHVLWTGVPTSHLLYIEKELATTLRPFVEQLPTRNQAEVWTTEGTEPGVARTDIMEVASTKKVPFNHVRSEAVPPHIAAVVDVLTRDEVVGYKTTVLLSGALDPRRKRQLLDRLTQVQEAVKFAREEANSQEVRDVKEGKKFFDWWLRA
jgi:hypothetical protein